MVLFLKDCWPQRPKVSIALMWLGLWLFVRLVEDGGGRKAGGGWRGRKARVALPTFTPALRDETSIFYGFSKL